MSTTPTTPTKQVPPSLSAILTQATEWLAGELAASPTALKIAGAAATVIGAVPGVLAGSTVRTALIGAGTFLVGIVHLAEAKK